MVKEDNTMIQNIMKVNQSKKILMSTHAEDHYNYDTGTRCSAPLGTPFVDLWSAETCLLAL